MRIVVLRLGHRFERDKRITTHVGLVARAFGAEEMLMTVRDSHVEESLHDVVQRWGGNFRLRVEVDWKTEATRWKELGGKVVHLTMYGTNLTDVIDSIKSCENIMTIVGAEKVPSELYELADWNVSIGNQPHSEVAALAVFLDRVFQGKKMIQEFPGALRIVPSARGKKIIVTDKEQLK